MTQFADFNAHTNVPYDSIPQPMLHWVEQTMPDLERRAAAEAQLAAQLDAEGYAAGEMRAAVKAVGLNRDAARNHIEAARARQREEEERAKVAAAGAEATAAPAPATAGG